MYVSCRIKKDNLIYLTSINVSRSDYIPVTSEIGQLRMHISGSPDICVINNFSFDIYKNFFYFVSNTSSYRHYNNLMSHEYSKGEYFVLLDDYIGTIFTPKKGEG